MLLFVIFDVKFQIKTTNYVCRTRNPTWEVSTEFIVGDFTKVSIPVIYFEYTDLGFPLQFLFKMHLYRLLIVLL